MLIFQTRGHLDFDEGATIVEADREECGRGVYFRLHWVELLELFLAPLVSLFEILRGCLCRVG